MTIGFAVDNVTKISFVSCVSTCAVGHLHDTCNVSIYRHRIYWDLLLAWVQNYYNSKDVILYSSVCTFSHLIPHVSAISTEHASKFNHLCYAKARPCFGLLVSLQWLKASKRIKLRVSLCFHPWLRMDPKLRDRKHPRQTRALCTLGRFSASSLQAFNLSIKVWSRQHKDLRINTLARVRLSRTTRSTSHEREIRQQALHLAFCFLVPLSIPPNHDFSSKSGKSSTIRHHQFLPVIDIVII